MQKFLSRITFMLITFIILEVTNIQVSNNLIYIFVACIMYDRCLGDK